MTLPIALDTNLLVRQALAWHHQGIDFADALHLLRSEGCARFATLDRALARAANALDLKPAVQPL
jgi:thermostable 8-oxoguanine DNA glycosylase